MVLTVSLVDNPAWRPDLDGERAFPRKVPALVNVNEGSIARLAAKTDRHGRPLISAAQVAAADRVRWLWETLSGSGVRAIDYSREPVDGGHIADPIKVNQVTAGRELAKAHQVLGRRNYRLVCKICGERMLISDLFHTQRERLTAADNLRASLDELCDLWGIAGTAPPSQPRKYRPRHKPLRS
jgi:hypothetical protein